MLWKFTSSEGPPELSACISQHWDALVRGDSAAALEFVVPECRERFVRWQKPPICSWLLENSRPIDADRFEVVVRVLIFTPIGYCVSSFRESWQRAADSWRVAEPPDLQDSLDNGGNGSPH